MLIYLLGIFIAAVLLSAALTPAVFMALLQFWPEMPWPFSRVLDRVFLVMLVILLFFFRKKMNLKAVSDSFVWPGRTTALKRIVIGFVLALSTALAASFYLESSGELARNQHGLSAILFKLLQIVPAALLIALIEEIFFRLLILKALRRKMFPIVAAICASVIYTLLHFIAPDKKFVFEIGNYLQGFEYIGVVARNALQADLLLPLFGLFLVGMLLAHVVFYQRSLLVCIGLHAGWITALKLTKYAYTIETTLPDHTLAARYFLVGQPLVWLSFGLILVILTLISRTNSFKNPDIKI